MRERYRYEIATSAQNGRWTPAVIRTDTFSRDPESIARGLLEQWIIDHAGRLRGGRVIVYTSATRAESARLLATVRVRVHKAGADDGAAPVAVAYLGEFDRSPRSRDLDRGPHQSATPHQRRRDRMRARLRLPGPRHGDQEVADPLVEMPVLTSR